MSAKPEKVIQDLEEALLERARALAEEYLARAQRARQHILEDAQERLHLREQQAVVRARAEADRYFRRQMQANELRLKKQLDQLRWKLIHSVLEELPRRLAQQASDRDRYAGLLRAFIRHAAQSIEARELVAELNEADLAWLQPQWDDFVSGLEPGKRIALHPRPILCSGGVLVRSKDNRIRVDNTFEGRRERHEMRLLQAITERLFAAEISERGLLHE